MTIEERFNIVQSFYRPNVLEYINYIFSDFIEMHGDRVNGDDSSVVGGIAVLNEMPVTLIGQVRGHNMEECLKYNFSMVRPEGFRKSLRLMKQAEKFSRPVICFVDTLGADPGVKAEEGGQSVAIANNLMEMMMLKIPIISVFIGYGCSGGAMAFAVANKVVFLENAYLSVISPKGCAKLLWNDSTRYIEAAEALKITAEENRKRGFVDTVIPEPAGGVHLNKEMVFRKLKSVLEEFLCKYDKMSGIQIQQERYKKYREIGKNLF